MRTNKHQQVQLLSKVFPDFFHLPYFWSAPLLFSPTQRQSATKHTIACPTHHCLSQKHVIKTDGPLGCRPLDITALSTTPTPAFELENEFPWLQSTLVAAYLYVFFMLCLLCGSVIWLRVREPRYQHLLCPELTRIPISPSDICLHLYDTGPNS